MTGIFSNHGTKTCKHCNSILEGKKTVLCNTCIKLGFYKCGCCGEIKECKHRKTFVNGKITYKIICNDCLIKNSHEQYTETNNDEWIECKICGFRAQELSTHVLNIHGIQPSEYGLTKCKKSRERVKGENNPGYQHGGKFSPWSKKSEHHTAEQIEEAVRKAAEKRVSTTELEYYTRQGMTEEEAIIARSERQTTFSLEKCIEKHGPIEGPMVWHERQVKWQDTLNAKSDEEKKRINRLKVGKGNAISKAETMLAEELRKSGINVNVQLQLKRNETKFYIYDIEFNNKIIEYNGDYWHCNPEIWKPDAINAALNKTAAQKWQEDANKIKFAKDSGYDVLVVWEKDFKKDQRGTLDTCINFLTQ